MTKARKNEGQDEGGDEPFEGVGNLGGSILVLRGGLVALGLGGILCSH